LEHTIRPIKGHVSASILNRYLFRIDREGNHLHPFKLCESTIGTLDGALTADTQAFLRHLLSQLRLDTEASCIHLAMMYYQGKKMPKDHLTCVELLKVAESMNSALASSYLAICKINGIGMQRDPAGGFNDLKSAAKRNVAVAMVNLARCYQYGLGCKLDISKAESWMTKAGKAGDTEILLMVSKFFSNLGQYDLAIPYLKKAAQAESIKACYLLGCYYRDGLGMKQNLNKAKYWLSKFAEDDAETCYTLGNLFLSNEEYNKAFEHLSSSANSGIIEAQYKLGYLYENGLGISTDLKSACMLYAEAAASDHSEACRRLGLCYWDGRGVIKDLGQAEKWLRYAMDLGSKDAVNDLAMLKEMEGDKLSDLKCAMKLYLKAATEHLDPVAHHNIADMYKSGKIFDENPLQMATEWYRKAAALGDQLALHKIKEIEKT
jgi:TPR repeat protein